MSREEPNNFEFFRFKTLLGIDQTFQIILLTLLYCLMVLGYFFQVRSTGKIDGYPPGASLLFVPFYEEFIFRGILLRFFERHYGFIKAIAITAILFGLWHLKNIFWLDPKSLIEQVLYTALFFGPLTGWITLKTRSLWPAVIIHHLNNFPYQALIESLKF